MNKTIFTFLVFTLLSLSSYSQITTEKYSKVKINLLGKDIKTLATLGLEVDHGVLVKGRYLINDFSESELQLINNANFQFEILVENVIAWYQDQHRENLSNLKSAPPLDCFNASSSSQPIYQTPVNYTYGSMGGYVTYSQMLEVLDSMYSKFPNLITQRASIGTIADTTHRGNRLQWLKISDNPNVDELESEVLFTSLHHAREPNSLAQNLFYMWYLLENYATDSEIAYLVDNTEIYFVPCVNPDGYILNELNNASGGGMIRKNGRDNNNDGIYNNQDGVDLNRNYGYEWAYDNTGSSPNPSSQTYRGTSGFSEPETQAIRDFCNDHEFQITLNYHTFGNLLIHPWGFTDVVTSEHEMFKTLGEEMIQHNHFTFGTGSETVGYTVNGDSDDWMYGETVSKGKIYSMTPEVGAQGDGFWPSQSNIDNLNKSVMHQNLSVSRLVLNYVEGEDLSSDVNIYGLNGNFDFKFLKKGLKAGSVTVDFTSVSPELTISFSPQILSLTTLQTQNVSVPYSIINTVNTDDELKFIVSVDNGLFTYYDTITKIFKTDVPTIAFEDNTNDLSNWTNNGWDVTTNEFYSAPNSICESPNGDYTAGQDKRITIVNAIDLTYASFAKVSFWAKWDIENDYDYTEILISTDNGVNFIPLCGKYSNEGTNDQDDGMPLYDGVQNDWVKESIDITEYIGGPVLLQFYFHSDNFVHGDGFYFDDFKVEAVIEAHTHLQETTIFSCDSINVGLVSDTFQNIWNMDSVITVNTVFAESYNQSLEILTINASEVGEFVDTFTSVHGCDSVINRSVVLNPNIAIVELGNVSVSVFPNPIYNTLNIRLNNSIEVTTISILNSLGQVTDSYKMAENQLVLSKDFSNYAKGIYYIKIQINNEYKTVRFLKM